MTSLLPITHKNEVVRASISRVFTLFPSQPSDEYVLVLASWKIVFTNIYSSESSSFTFFIKSFTFNKRSENDETKKYNVSDGRSKIYQLVSFEALNSMRLLRIKIDMKKVFYFPYITVATVKFDFYSDFCVKIDNCFYLNRRIKISKVWISAILLFSCIFFNYRQ